MASIIMKRGIASEISNTPISDGQILFETDTKNIYIDEGSNRTKYRALTVDIDNTLSTTSVNPVQNKVVTTKVNNLEGRINTINPRADSGYVIIGDALIQWGRKDLDTRVSDNHIYATISLPTPFADINYAVNLTLSYYPETSSYYDATTMRTFTTLSSFQAKVFSKSGGFTTADFTTKPVSVAWIAIGKYTA